MKNNIPSINDAIEIKKEKNSISVKHKNGFNLTICFCDCNCNCECNKSNSHPKIPHSVRISNNNNVINLKQNSFKSNSFSKNPKSIKREYSFDYNNNNIEVNQKLRDSSSKESTNKKNYLRNEPKNNFEQKTYDLLSKQSIKFIQENKDTKDLNNNNIINNFNYPNNDFIYYKNNLNNTNQFVKNLNEIQNKEIMAKSSSFRDFRYDINNYTNNINQDQDNINIVYDCNNFIQNSNILENNTKNKNKYNGNKKYPKNKDKNILKNNSDNKKLLYNDKNKNENKINYNNSRNNYNTNYICGKNDIFDNNEFNIIDNNLNPLGHIVDNFVNMMKNKYLYKNQKNKNKKNIINKKNNYKDNKYNDYIKQKKNNFNNLFLTNKNNFSNYTYYQYDNYSNLANKINELEIKSKNNINNKNGIKKRKEDYGKKYGYSNNNNIKINSKNIEDLINKYSSLTNNTNYKINKYNEDYIQKESYLNSNNSNENNENEKYNLKNSEQINKYEDVNNTKINDNINNNMNYSNAKLDDEKIDILEKYDNNINKENLFEIEKFDFKINDNKNNNKIKINNRDNINEISENKTKNNYHKITLKLDNIQNPNSNISPYINFPKNKYIISKQNTEQIQFLPKHININKIKQDKTQESEMLSVSERVRQYIEQKAKINKIPLSSKLNLDTNLTLTEDNEIENQNDNNNYINYNKILRNIGISQNTIFTLYYNNNKPTILVFDIENKTFSFHDYSDFGNFEENFKKSLRSGENKNNNGNLYITIDTNLYIITGKNHDLLYIFDSLKKSINKLCNLKNNHSNGNLLYYENNLICLSGDFNKKVEIYSIQKNEWDNLPEMITERSNSGTCIINNKNSKYILNIFGYNYPTNEYLNTIEYLDINDKDTNWKYLNYNNQSLIPLDISNFFCINYNDEKIILIGGYNENENKYNDKFIQINLESNFENNCLIEETERKLKDIDFNKKIIFYNNGYKSYFKKNKNGIFYGIFDNNLNCHLFQSSNLAHDIFYFNC